MNLLIPWYPGDALVKLATRLLIDTTVLIAVAGLLASCLLRHRPAARHALWLCTLMAVIVAPLTQVAVDAAGCLWTVERPRLLVDTALSDSSHYALPVVTGERPPQARQSRELPPEPLRSPGDRLSDWRIRFESATLAPLPWPRVNPSP